MLRISKLADYGTLVMAFLAKNPNTSTQSNARTIAAETHLSVPTVSKLLKLLAHAGLLVSHRGTRGGYQLARSADEISIADIILALEEKMGLTECSHAGHHCALSPLCTTQDNWLTLNRAIQQAMKSVSLDALASPHFTEQMIDVSAIKKVNHYANRKC